MKTSIVIFTIVTLTLVELALAGRGNRNKKPACRYNRVKWSDCNTATNKMTRTVTLKANQLETCPPTKVEEKECGSKGSKLRCKYQRAAWEACDESTGQMTMVKTLVPGSPENCPPTKNKERRCRKPKGGKGKGKGRDCYEVITSACQDGLETTTFTVKDGADATKCPPKQPKTRSCRGNGGSQGDKKAERQANARG